MHQKNPPRLVILLNTGPCPPAPVFTGRWLGPGLCLSTGSPRPDSGQGEAGPGLGVAAWPRQSRTSSTALTIQPPASSEQ